MRCLAITIYTYPWGAHDTHVAQRAFRHLLNVQYDGSLSCHYITVEHSGLNFDHIIREAL